MFSSQVSWSCELAWKTWRHLKMFQKLQHYKVIPFVPPTPHPVILGFRVLSPSPSQPLLARPFPLVLPSAWSRLSRSEHSTDYSSVDWAGQNAAPTVLAASLLTLLPHPIKGVSHQLPSITSSHSSLSLLPMTELTYYFSDRCQLHRRREELSLLPMSTTQQIDDKQKVWPSCSNVFFFGYLWVSICWIYWAYVYITCKIRTEIKYSLRRSFAR